jgi:hypothetical protein
MKLTLTFLAALSLGLAAGCNADGKKKDDKGAAKDVPGDEQGDKLGETGDKANEDSPDAEFYAEQFVLDGFETDDAEAFQGENPPTASLALNEGENEVGEDEPTLGETSDEVTDNEIEEKLTPPSDEDPTANDKKLVDLIAEFSMGIADADGDGALSRTEFVDARYFPDLPLSDEVLARIKERRGKIFDKQAGDDDSMSQDELLATLDHVAGAVKKLRLLRYLPYADHLTKAWSLKKKEFDANGDGKLDQDELKKLRDARHELKQKRRAAVLAASYGLCHKFIDFGGSMPDWFQQMRERWDAKIQKKEKFKDKFGDSFKKKHGDKPEPKETGGNLKEDDPEPSEEDEADVPVGGDKDKCAPILDQAMSFGMSEAVLKILKDRGIIQE